MYTPSFNRIDDERPDSALRGRGAIGRVRHGRSGRTSRRHPAADHVGRRHGRGAHGACQPAVEGHHAGQPGAADLFGTAGLRQPVVVRGEGRTRPGGADVELQRRAPVRHGEGARGPRLAARCRHPADRDTRTRAQRTVATERRAAALHRRPARRHCRAGDRRHPGRGQGEAEPEPLRGRPPRGRQRPSRRTALRSRQKSRRQWTPICREGGTRPLAVIGSGTRCRRRSRCSVRSAAAPRCLRRP